MMRRTTGFAIGLLPLMPLTALAQDVPGIEICTVDKTMERRTSCLQSNVDFLVKMINRLRTEQEQKLGAANARVEQLSNAVIALQKTVAELQSAKKDPVDQQPPPTLKAAPDSKDAPATKDAPDARK